jgi:predicted MFS family arabinose efflux permease
MQTAVPGNKIYKGIVFGLAEAVAALLSGYLCTYMKDSSAFLWMAALCFTSNVCFYLLADESVVATFLLFMSVFGMGAMLNIFYLMIEIRVPPETLGSSIVLVNTISVAVASATPLAAYAP